MFDSHLLLHRGPSAGRGAGEFSSSGEGLVMTFSPCPQEQTALCCPSVYRGGVWVWLWSHLLLLWHFRQARPQMQWQEGGFSDSSWSSDLPNHSIELALFPPVILHIPGQKHSCERCQQPGELCTGPSRLSGHPVCGVVARGLLLVGCSTCCVQMLRSELS